MKGDKVIIGKEESYLYISKTLVIRILISGFLVFGSIFGWLALETYKTRILVAEIDVEVRNLKRYVLDKKLRGEEFTKTEAKLLMANIKNWANNEFEKK